MVREPLWKSHPANEQVFLNRSQFQGPRWFVQQDGSFDLGVATGFHRLRLVDANTGLLLGSSSDRVQVKSGAVAKADLDLAPGRSEVKLCLPEGSLAVLARHNVPPLAREELEVAFGDGPPKQLTLKIGAPPEVPVKDEEEEGEGEGEGEGEATKKYSPRHRVRRLRAGVRTGRW